MRVISRPTVCVNGNGAGAEKTPRAGFCFLVFLLENYAGHLSGVH